MDEEKFVFGPVPSRRLGESVGVSPIPEKTCNYSCVYCQLGRTNKMTATRREYFPLEDILAQVKDFIESGTPYDVVSIVGEGEPTLYSRLGELICGIKAMTEKPVAVITNGALLCKAEVREELKNADIVLPSFDAFDEESFKKIDRPHGLLKYDEIYNGLVTFSNEYDGQLYLEVMLCDGMNTSDEQMQKLAAAIKNIRHDKLYVNTPVRPPAEDFVKAADRETVEKAVNLMDGISIDMLTSGSFYSDKEDNLDAILNICRRHPMNHFEIEGFLKSRSEADIEGFFERLTADEHVTVLDYKGIKTYRVN